MGGGIVISVIVAWLTPVIKNALPLYISKLYSVSIIPYLWMFLVAAFAAEYKDKILPFLKKYWWVLFALYLIKKYALQWDVRLSLYNFFGTLLTFGWIVGFAYTFPQINVKTDISYGVYIYHMTIVNALMALGFIGQSWTLWVVIVVTCVLAWISTITIGKMSAQKKQKLT